MTEGPTSSPLSANDRDLSLMPVVRHRRDSAVVDWHTAGGAPGEGRRVAVEGKVGGRGKAVVERNEVVSEMEAHRSSRQAAVEAVDPGDNRSVLPAAMHRPVVAALPAAVQVLVARRLSWSVIARGVPETDGRADVVVVVVVDETEGVDDRSWSAIAHQLVVIAKSSYACGPQEERHQRCWSRRPRVDKKMHGHIHCLVGTGGFAGCHSRPLRRGDERRQRRWI